MKLRDSVKKQLYAIRSELVDVCEECSGIGYLEPDVPGEEKPCRCMAVYQYVMELVIANIPQRYWTLELEELQVDDLYIELASKYIQNIDRAKANGLGMIFFGSNGTGKTSIMCELGKAAVISGYRTTYVTAQQFIDSKVGSKKNEDTLAVLDDCENSDVILLDEVDKMYMKSGSDYVLKTIEDFLRRTLSSNRIVIACTNHTQDEFSEMLGSSTVSMLKRHNQFVQVDGPDYSDEVQSEWKSLLEGGFNYYSDALVNDAKKFLDKNREKDRAEWKQQPTEQD